MPDDSESWFDNIRPSFDRLLECLEVATVLIVVAAIIGATGYEIHWVFFGDPALRQPRLAAVVKALNENWKAGLILLVPLFYRTIRGFLERLEEFGGAKASPRLPRNVPQEKPNPLAQTQASQKQEF